MPYLYLLSIVSLGFNNVLFHIKWYYEEMVRYMIYSLHNEISDYDDR